MRRVGACLGGGGVALCFALLTKLLFCIYIEILAFYFVFILDFYFIYYTMYNKTSAGARRES